MVALINAHLREPRKAGLTYYLELAGLVVMKILSHPHHTVALLGAWAKKEPLDSECSLVDKSKSQTTVASPGLDTVPVPGPFLFHRENKHRSGWPGTLRGEWKASAGDKPYTLLLLLQPWQQLGPISCWHKLGWVPQNNDSAGYNPACAYLEVSPMVQTGTGSE